MNTEDSEHDTLPPSLIARIFLPFAFGYFLSQHFRAVNAIIAPDLVRDIRVDPMQLGILTSAYFLTFAMAQLPLGILLDKFGPRRVEVILLVVAALGAALFGSAVDVPQMIVGRALIGLGVSCCCVGAFKAFVIWFPRDKLPFANGCIMAAGALGILMSTVPIEAALAFIDWRELHFVLALLCLTVSISIFVLIPERKVQGQGESISEQLSGLVFVVRSSYFWRIIPFAVLLEGGAIGFITLWAGPWLRDVCGYTRDEVATGLFMISLSMIVGFPFHGYIASRLNRRGFDVMTVSVVGMSISLIFAFIAFFNLAKPILIYWILFFFFATTTISIFAALSHHFPKKLAARSNTALNFLIFLGAFATQVGIGTILKSYNVPAGEDGYSLEGYRTVSEIFIALQLAGLLWYIIFGWFLKRRTLHKAYAV